MDMSPQIFTATVSHQRFTPKVNAFRYGVYYLALPLPAQKLPSRLLSFYAKDVGFRDGRDPLGYANHILEKLPKLHSMIDHIILITMPRVLGYVFNPVSFYLCFDQARSLRSVICEVHNTFKEQHTYLCAHPDYRTIDGDDRLYAQKVFHVSPFFGRSGDYEFRFSLKDGKLGVWINYLGDDDELQLTTSLIGRLAPLTRQSLRAAFWSHPLVTIKAMTLIHWQALKLVLKGARYRPKPMQMQKTDTQNYQRRSRKPHPNTSHKG